MKNEPLVSAKWLVENGGRPGLVVLDLQSEQGYRRLHIPGAVHSDYALWRDRGMLPATPLLEERIGALGIGNESQVVIAAPGAGVNDLAMATRVYWSLKAVGHDPVAVLEGGSLGYLAQFPERAERAVNAPLAVPFKAHPRMEMAPDLEAVKEALARGVPMVDSRAPGQHLGLHPSKHRAGTIPGAANLPFDWLTVDGAVFHPPGALARIFGYAGVAAEGEQIHFCNSGHTASVVWFVAHELLGNGRARLYAGSMNEWSARPELPMERKVKLS